MNKTVTVPEKPGTFPVSTIIGYNARAIGAYTEKVGTFPFFGNGRTA
jgi:hypothetical protein